MKNKSAYHWLLVAACCGVICGSLGIAINCAGIFYTPVSDALGVGRGDISMYSTICNLTGGLLSPVIAKLLGKIKLSVLMGAGIIMLSAALAGMSLANSVVIFYLLAIVVGIGFSCCGTIPIAIIIGNWFSQKHGLVMGLTMCFSGIGGAVFTPILSALISSVGWRSTYVIAAIIILVLGLPGIIFIIRLHPSHKNLLPYGDSGEAANISQSGRLPTITTKNLVTTVFVTACMFTVFTSFVTGMGSHFPGYAEEYQFGTAAGALMLTAGMVGNIVFKLLLGVFSDIMGAVKTCALWMAICAAALGLLSFISVSDILVPIILAFLFGSCYAVAAVGVPLVIKQVFGIRNYPVVFSYASIFSFAGGAVALSIIGYIYDIFGSYKVATMSCMVLAALAIASLITTDILGKRKYVRD